MKNNKYSFARSLYELVEMFAIAMAAALIVMALFIRHSPVSGHSMYPTLLGSPVSSADEFAAPEGKNDILIVATLPTKIKDGDIIVTQTKNSMQDPYVKRVIATGGQTLSIDFESWTVTVDGKVLDESYVHREETQMLTETFYESMSGCEKDENGAYIIPEGYVFCMGDNRNHSSDSRDSRVGLIDERFILGKAVFRIYPFDRIGVVN